MQTLETSTALRETLHADALKTGTVRMPELSSAPRIGELLGTFDPSILDASRMPKVKSPAVFESLDTLKPEISNEIPKRGRLQRFEPITTGGRFKQRLRDAKFSVTWNEFALTLAAVLLAIAGLIWLGAVLEARRQRREQQKRDNFKPPSQLN